MDHPYREAPRVVDVPARAGTGLGWLRAAALVIDYGFAFFVMGVLGACGMIALEGTTSQGLVLSFTLAYVGLGFLLIFGRDSVRGRSLGRRFFGLQVVDVATGRPAHPLRCAVREFVSMNLLHIDAAAMCYLADGRSLGDRIMNTRVVSLEQGAGGPATRVLRSLGITLAVLILMTPLWILMFAPDR